MQTGGFSHECDKQDNTRTTITQRERYIWKPLKCDLMQWNATLFCELLGERVILMVGDSTMHQTGAALMSRITWDRPNADSCAPNLALGRINMFGQEDGMAKLKGSIIAVQPDILILNTGAHFLLSSTYEADLQHLDTLREEVFKYYPRNISIVWKTMNPGHVNCSAAPNGPLTESWDHRHTGNRDLYNWWMQPKMDQLAKQKAQQLGFGLVDMTPLYYGSDAHPYGRRNDCLHYCLPGAPDLFSVLLMNMLYNREL
jgi:hypothetical protein